MSCPQFIADSMAVRTATHLLHLSSNSHPEHVALGDFYEALSDLIDAYAEIYQGLEGQIKVYPDAKLSKAPPLPTLDAYLDLLADEMAEDHDSEALKNVLAEIEALTARTIYKLKFLK